MEVESTILLVSSVVYVVLLVLQLPLTALLAMSNHGATGTAFAVLLYAVIWPFVGSVGGIISEFIGIAFGFSAAVVQLSQITQTDVFDVQMVFGALAFFACIGAVVMTVPCARALGKLQERQERSNSARVDLQVSHNQIVGAREWPAALPPVESPPWTPRRDQEEKKTEWVTVVSPDNHIALAIK